MLCESEEKTLHKSDEKYQAYVKILEEELIPAMGCTEPIAIAYAGAVARKTANNYNVFIPFDYVQIRQSKRNPL